MCDGTWNGLSTKLLKKLKFKFSFLNGTIALDLDDIINEAYREIVKEWYSTVNNENNQFESKEIWLFGFSHDEMCCWNDTKLWKYWTH